VAGIAFAVLFGAALVLLRNLPIVSVDDAQIAEWFRTGGDTAIIIGGLYLAPFAGIAFLWFIAVVRDQIGEREDRFFATVFFGSGLLFVALLFSAAAIVSALAGVRYLGCAIGLPVGLMLLATPCSSPSPRAPPRSSSSRPPPSACGAPSAGSDRRLRRGARAARGRHLLGLDVLALPPGASPGHPAPRAMAAGSAAGRHRRSDQAWPSSGRTSGARLGDQAARGWQRVGGRW
jgi:hypothetical protein